MIIGSVTHREANIRLWIVGRRGKRREVEVTVDSGFTDFLTLPLELIAALGLRWHSSIDGILADDSQVSINLYVAKIIWDGIEQEIEVGSMEGSPLVGMGLLEDYELKIEVRETGRVTIKRLALRQPRK